TFDWVYLCRMMHQQLLLNYEIGHWPVAISTLIMFFMLISGLYLWWPKTRKNLSQRLKIKWDGKWRRKNYDLHSTLGFYSLLFVLFFATTGLVWSFDWWTDGLYRLFGADPNKVFTENYQEFETEGAVKPKLPIVDFIIQDLKSQRSNWKYAALYFPKEEKANYSAYLPYSGFSGWDLWDSYSYDASNGRLKSALRHENKNAAEKWRNSNYAWHVGSIFGVGTKILATLVSIICASLPISGFLLWYGRKYKKKKVSLQKELYSK
ncbi:MAG: PepSY-associated TM helix domain-containing protein, partial [Candidatus Paceibacterota bacterium]